jgi:hypothetical protein
LPSGHVSSRRHDILWSTRPNAQPIAVCYYSIHQFSRAIRNVLQTQTDQSYSTDPTDPTDSRNPQFHLVPLPAPTLM